MFAGPERHTYLVCLLISVCGVAANDGVEVVRPIGARISSSSTMDTFGFLRPGNYTPHHHNFTPIPGQKCVYTQHYGCIIPDKVRLELHRAVVSCL